MRVQPLLTLSLCLGLPWLGRAGDAAALWTGKVQPLLDVQCAKCHGPIEQKGGLELDTPEAVLKGGDEGPAVVPGKPEESRLYTYLAADADPHMPPKKQLSEAERAVVQEWILALGAKPAEPVAKAPAVPREFDSVTAAVDTLVAEGWAQRGVSAAAPVDDRGWLRRVTLDLAGRIPTPAEMAEFSQAPAESRRAAVVERLLASDDYPVRMRELWDTFLMGRGKRDSSEDRRKKNGWWAFLEHSFRTNRPWNETVRDLLVARPDKPETRGASWFLFERRNEHQQIAEAVAPIVYGAKIDCAQCHDHPLAREIKQGHYWGLVAAFNRSKNVEGTSSVAESAVGGFVNFTNLHKESQPATVTLLTGHTVPETWPAGDKKEEDSEDKYVDAKAKVKVPKFSRREAFADAATHNNPLLARAFVNRLWAALLGRGLVHPVDEMTARNPPSHPELLDWLARDFAANRYDIRRLIRGIVLSRAYALGPAAATPPEAFAGSLERPLTAEQIARSWRIACGLPADDDTLRRAAITALPDVLPANYNATFQQAQFLTNSPVLADLLKPANGNTTERLASLLDHAAKVREAFAAVHGRGPDAEENASAEAFMASRPEDPAGAVRDLLWALLTSAEFLMVP
jgi:mono/diheme cytochrome c family protein